MLSVAMKTPSGAKRTLPVRTPVTRTPMRSALGVYTATPPGTVAQMLPRLSTYMKKERKVWRYRGTSQTVRRPPRRRTHTFKPSALPKAPAAPRGLGWANVTQLSFPLGGISSGNSQRWRGYERHTTEAVIRLSGHTSAAERAHVTLRLTSQRRWGGFSLLEM